VLENTPPPTRLTPPIIPLYDLPVADDWDEDTTATEQSVVTNIDGQAPCLTILTGSSVGQTFKVTKGNALIGRGQEAHVRILDDGVSRQHARLKFDTGGNLYVVDLSSRNGTYVNGKKIGEQIQLQAGDKIQVGRTTVLRFEYQDAIDQSFHENLLSSALRDGLTRLFNKRYFMDRLDAELKFARRHQTVVSLLMLDLDHFKKINDDHGHLAGDAVLVHFASLVLRAVRNEDVVARFGGEEIAVILRAIPVEPAAALAERLRKLVEGTPVEYNGRKLVTTVSIGVAGYPTTNAETVEALVDAADQALYRAKNGGRNRVQR
jgi:two-component system, cell cycle response regulator